jgi:hypothetical protein
MNPCPYGSHLPRPEQLPPIFSMVACFRKILRFAFIIASEVRYNELGIATSPSILRGDIPNTFQAPLKLAGFSYNFPLNSGGTFPTMLLWWLTNNPQF